MSPSPVQSMTRLARIASRPFLESMITPLTVLPSMMTSVAKAYISRSMPHSLIIWNARCFVPSGSIIVRLTWSGHARWCVASPFSCRRSTNCNGRPLMTTLPLRPRNPSSGRPMVMLPPKKPRLSTSITLVPFSKAAAWAAISPAGPAPTTRTSTSARTGIRRAGSSICFIFGIG